LALALALGVVALLTSLLHDIITKVACRLWLADYKKENGMEEN